MINILAKDPESLTSDQELIEIIRQTPIPGSVAYHYDRSSGFEAYARSQGTSFKIIEARENEELLGFTQITFDQVCWNQSPVTIAYSGDTRVAQKARGRKISDALIQISCKQEVPVFGAVMGNNKLVLDQKLTDWENLGIHFSRFAKMKALLFRPAKSNTITPELFSRTAQESDLPAMFYLWKQYSNSRNLPRHYDHLDTFSNAYLQNNGISLKSTFLVFDGDSLIAMMSVWDQSKVRKLIVDEKNMMMKIASRFLALPEPGEELKVHYGYQHAFLEKHPQSGHAMKILIARARSHAFACKAHFFTLGMDEKDPILQAIQKSSIVSNTVNIILDPRGNQEFSTSNLPLHLEVGMG